MCYTSRLTVIWILLFNHCIWMRPHGDMYFLLTLQLMPAIKHATIYTIGTFINPFTLNLKADRCLDDCYYTAARYTYLHWACHTISGPPQKRSPRTVYGRLIGPPWDHPRRHKQSPLTVSGPPTCSLQTVNYEARKHRLESLGRE